MHRAFTLIELIVAIGVISIFLLTVLPNMLAPVTRSSFAETLALLSSDFRTQQLKAMLGSPDNSVGPTVYGIHLNEDNYVMFSGPGYQAANPINFTVNLDPGLIFSFIDLPGADAVFATGSGQILNFTNTRTFTLLDTRSGQSRIISVNGYGVIDDIQ